MGIAAEPLKQGLAGRYLRAARILTAVGGAAGSDSRTANSGSPAVSVGVIMRPDGPAGVGSSRRG